MRFAVYASSRGDYFFAEVRRLLAAGLRDAGARAEEADERAGFAPGADWHLVVGPQQFFYLGRGERLRLAPWPRGVILYNAEQPGSGWFSLVERLAPRAHAVWDMNRELSRRWSKRGLRSGRLPLGWASGSGLFDPVRRLPPLALTAGLRQSFFRGDSPEGRLSRRPLDVLFAGSLTPRRERFFADAAAAFSRRKTLIRLVDDSKFLRPRKAELHSRAMLGLAQRAKIVLNIHRRPSLYFEWHRVAVHGLGQGALVISEPAGDTLPLRPGRDFVAAGLREIPEAVEYYLSSSRGLLEAQEIASRGRSSYASSCRLAGFLGPLLGGLGEARRTPAETAARLLLSLPR